MPVTGPLVSATYTTTTSTRSSAAVPPTTKRARLVCNASARAIATENAGRLHSRSWSDASAYRLRQVPRAAACSTISTASSDVKSTAGRITIALYSPAPLRTDCI